MVIVLGVCLLGASLVFIWYDLQLRPAAITRLGKPGAPIGFTGATHLNAEDLKKTLASADAELDRRYDNADALRLWSRIATWLGIILTSFMTVIAGFYGGRATADGDPGATLEKVLREQQMSKGLIRVAGALIALATLPSLFAQRLESDANYYAASARELHAVYVESEGNLYDPTPEAEQMKAFQRIKQAIRQR